MVENIFRRPTEAERADFNPLGLEDPETKFRAKLADERLRCQKENKPFAFKAALDKFRDAIANDVKKSQRKNGYVKFEEIKVPEIDLKEFSDLKNFEVVEDGERYDEDLSKRNPGLDVRIKFIKYKYTGYGGNITMMEDSASAIQRAQEKKLKLEKEVKKK
jgi:hypothetical protein